MNSTEKEQVLFFRSLGKVKNPKKINTVFLILLFFISAFVNLEAQRLLKLTLDVGGETKHVSYIVRNGVSYASALELATALNGSYYYNDDAAKLELKFDKYNLKFTARNQFVVLINRSNLEQQVFQIPISTLLVKNDVMIPLNYTIKFVGFAYGKDIKYDEGRKHITVTKEAPDFIPDLPAIPSVTEETKEKEVPAEKKETKATEVVSKYDIYDLTMEEKSNGTMIRLRSQKELKGYRSSIKNNKLYLFLTGTTVDPNITKSKPAGLVKKIERKNIGGNIQIEFELSDGFSSHETFEDIESRDILITVHNKMFDTKPTVDFEKKKDGWKFDVVVIDPGHGGKDPGAIGVTGVKEKDINLSIGLKLGNLIKQKLQGVDVVYTRNDDRFVELYKRGKIANENNGKLFISIHCNALAQKPSPTRGFEVYLLRPGRTKRAIEIAEFENRVIQYEDNPDRYQALTDENFILVSMAHSAYMRYSEKFSDLLNQKWNQYASIPSRGVKQAGFYVLVGASMPSVLVETGFLTNRQDEAYLRSSKGQQEIADAIFNSILSYKEYYDKAFEESVY